MTGVRAISLFRLPIAEGRRKGSPRSIKYTGYAYEARWQVGRVDEALTSYERAFAAEPSYADGLHNVALLLMRKCQFSAAAKLLDWLVSTSESNSGEARRLAHLCRLELKQELARK